MAACTPTPIQTLFTTVTSTVVVTTFTISLQTLPDTTSTFVSSSCLSTLTGICVSSTEISEVTVIPGGVSTVSEPLIITSIITEADPVSTLFASCPSPSSPISSTSTSSRSSSTSQSPSQPSPVTSIIPTTIAVTSTPSPTVITKKASSTLDNGVVTVITVISTSTPPPTVVHLSTVISQPTATHKSSVAIAPIVGGAVGGFICLIAAVFAIWFIIRKCCRSPRDNDEDDIVFPYPVTRDRGHAQHLDLSHEPKPYVYGHVGRSAHDAAVMAPRSSLSHSRGGSDGRPDSATALIGASSGFSSMSMASGAGGFVVPSGSEVGRQTSHGSIGQLPPGAAAPSSYLDGSSGSGDPTAGSSRYPLQVVNPPSSIRSSFRAELAEGSSSSKAPLVASEGGSQSARAEKMSASAPLPEDEVVIHTDGGRLPVSDHGASASGSGSKTPPVVLSHSEAPPAYEA